MCRQKSLHEMRVSNIANHWSVIYGYVEPLEREDLENTTLLLRKACMKDIRQRFQR